MGKDTIVINIIGGPGVGKTTIASELFSKLKKLGYDVENVSEFAKELVWENNISVFNDRLYMHATQNHRMFQMNHKLDFIITDSPLLLTSVYNNFYLKDAQSKSYNAMIDQVVEETWKLYNNVTYYIERKTFYNMIGRRENMDEALTIDQGVKQYLQNHDIPYQTLDANNAADVILEDILKNKNN